MFTKNLNIGIAASALLILSRIADVYFSKNRLTHTEGLPYAIIIWLILAQLLLGYALGTYLKKIGYRNMFIPCILYSIILSIQYCFAHVIPGRSNPEILKLLSDYALEFAQFSNLSSVALGIIGLICIFNNQALKRHFLLFLFFVLSLLGGTLSFYLTLSQITYPVEIFIFLRFGAPSILMLFFVQGHFKNHLVIESPNNDMLDN